MLCWILLVVLVIFFYVKVVKRQQYWKEKNVPHDKPRLILGNIEGYGKVSLAENMLKNCQKYKDKRYFGLYQLWMPLLMIKDIDLIKQITIKEIDSFPDHITFASEKIDPLLANNLFLMKGQKWKNMRSILSPAFTSSKMRLMFNLMSDCAEQFTNYFLTNAIPGKHTTVEMKDIFTRYSNDAISTSVFGVKCDSLLEKENEIYVMGKRATDFSGVKGLKILGYTIFQSIMEIFKIRLVDLDVDAFFRNLIMTTMQTREENGIIRPDLIHLLMEARKGNLKYEETPKRDEDAGFATVEESYIGREKHGKNMDLSDDDIISQALGFYLAGFDTVSTLLCHMANELAVNPDIEQKLQAEVDETLQNCKGGEITYDAITKMKYMDMVISETLRKWPPTPLTTRVCNRNFTIEPVLANEQPVTLEKGDPIWIPIYAIQHNPEYFPNPERFDPERFNDENKDNITPGTYLPFGAGSRNCIGSRLALLEAKIIFVHILSKFDIVIDEKTQIPLKLSTTDFNMNAEKGFWLGLKPR